MVRGLALIAAAACGHSAARAPAIATNAASSDDVTLYRDTALVKQRVEVEIGKTGLASIPVMIATGLDADQVIVVERGGVDVRGVHGETVAAPPINPAPSAVPDEDTDGTPDPVGAGSGSGSGSAAPVTALVTGTPSQIHIDLAGAPGKHTLVLGYLTDRLRWDAAYTMIATPARDRVVVRGALAIRNTTGVAYRASVHLVDAELGAWRGRIAEKLATTLVGSTPGSTPMAAARDLGAVAIAQGETRVELMPTAKSRAMRSVLVYDPIGTKLDNPSAQPVRDPTIGAQPASPRLTESFEVERDEDATAGLPGGPVRLLERRPDGSLGVLGEARMFDAATRVADVDTIAIGTADGIAGQRERRELTIDETNRRVVEEVAIAIDNHRSAPATVLLREHMYRGQNWNLAWWSTPGATKEGPQQIALRTTVPAKTKQRVLYVVVYTW
jgi:hypothetical protein